VRRSRTAFALGVVVLPLVLGGCSGDDPEPKFAPPESTSPTESGSPSAPASSASANRRDEQAGLINDYFSAISDAISSGDPSRFLALATKDCANCRVIGDNLVQAYAGGGHIEGGHWAVVSSRFVRQAPLGSIWNVDIRSARERWLDRDGQPVKVVDPGVQHFGVALQVDRSVWRVREMKLR
jgi:hypothetical protein